MLGWKVMVLETYRDGFHHRKYGIPPAKQVSLEKSQKKSLGIIIPNEVTTPIPQRIPQKMLNPQGHRNQSCFPVFFQCKWWFRSYIMLLYITLILVYWMQFLSFNFINKYCGASISSLKPSTSLNRSCSLNIWRIELNTCLHITQQWSQFHSSAS